MLDFAFAIIMIVVGAVIGYSMATDHMEREAVESGAACYVLNDDHKRQFKWGSCEE